MRLRFRFVLGEKEVGGRVLFLFGYENWTLEKKRKIKTTYLFSPQ